MKNLPLSRCERWFCVVGVIVMVAVVVKLEMLKKQNDLNKLIRAESYKKGYMTCFADVIDTTTLTTMQKEKLYRLLDERYKAEKEKIINAK